MCYYLFNNLIIYLFTLLLYSLLNFSHGLVILKYHKLSIVLITLHHAIRSARSESRAALQGMKVENPVLKVSSH